MGADAAAPHPGDAYARSEIEAFYAFNIRVATWNLADAEPRQPGAVAAARRELAEFENAYAAWREKGVMPWRHVEMFAAVAGSVGGGLAAGFAPVDHAPPGRDAADGPTDRENATRVYLARQAVVWDAMRRWGWWLPGDPPTAEFDAEHDA